MTTLNLHYLLQGPIFKYSHIAGLRPQHTNFEGGGHNSVHKTLFFSHISGFSLLLGCLSS